MLTYIRTPSRVIDNPPNYVNLPAWEFLLALELRECGQREFTLAFETVKSQISPAFKNLRGLIRDDSRSSKKKAAWI